MLALLRQKVKPIIELIAMPFVILRIRANFVSILGVIFASIAAYNIFLQDYYLGLIFTILAVIPDLIDGAVARGLNQTSPWGNYFETMIDKVVMTLLIGSLIFVDAITGLLALSFSWISSYAKPRAALVIITDNRDWPAIGEHSDKLILLILGLLVVNIYPVIYEYHTLMLTALVIFAVSFIGSIQRIFYAKKLIQNAEKEGNLLPYLKEKKER